MLSVDQVESSFEMVVEQTSLFNDNIEMHGDNSFENDSSYEDEDSQSNINFPFNSTIDENESNLFSDSEDSDVPFEPHVPFVYEEAKKLC